MAVSAKFIADFTSFYDAVQKAEIELKGFEAGANTVQAALNRMGNAFSGRKVIQEAELMAKAIGDIQNVALLTEKEQARVNAVVSEAIEKYQALGKIAPDALLDLQKATTKTAEATGGFFGDLTSQVKATALGFVSAQAIIGGVQTGFRALTGFVNESIASYANAESAAKKMTTALQSQGTATPAVIESFNDLATQFQRTTVYSDDLINQMEALLTEVGNVAPSQMNKALTAATDLASGLGIDLQQATMLVGKAFAGETGTLSRYGVVIDEARLKAEGMPAVLEAIQQKFGGQAQAELDTYSGKLKQIANDWDNIKEAVGKKIVQDPLLQSLLRTTADEIKKQSEAVTGSESSWSKWIDRLNGFVSPAQAAVGQLEELADNANTLAEAAERMNRVQSPFKSLGDFSGFDAKAKAFAQTIANDWVKAAEAAAAAAKKWADELDAAFRKWSGADLAEQMKILDITFRRMADSGQITAQQVNAMAAEAAKLFEQGAKLTPRLFDIVMATNQISPAMMDASKAISEFGSKVELAIPQMDEFNKAVLDLDAKTKSGDWGTITNLGFKAADGFKEGARAIDDFNKRLAALGSEIARAFSGGGGFVSGLKNLGTSIAKDFVSETLSFVPVIGPLLQQLGGPIVDGFKKLFGGIFGSAGRDAVKDFAASMGGFDALQAKLNELGDEGQRLWIALTQGVGKNNPQQAQAAIDAVTAALDRQKSKAADAAQAAADSAAEQAKAQQAALDQITAKYADTISKLDSEYKQLNDSVSQEAEEAVMGVVETQQRERMKQIEAEKAAQEAMRDAEVAAKKLTFEQWVKDGKATRDDLDEIFGKELVIPYKFVQENSPSPDGGGSYYVPPIGGGAGASRITVVTNLDGEVIATSTAKYLPQVLRRRGVVA